MGVFGHKTKSASREKLKPAENLSAIPIITLQSFEQHKVISDGLETDNEDKTPAAGANQEV